VPPTHALGNTIEVLNDTADERVEAVSPLLLDERDPALGAEDKVVVQAEIVRHS
jgi:hypothetical protein